MLLSQLHFVFGALHNVHEQDQIENLIFAENTLIFAENNLIFAENTLIFVKIRIFQDVRI